MTLSGIVILLSNTVAQSGQKYAVTMDRPVARAVFLEEDPVIDGNILEDAVWSQIAPFGEFWQTQPHAGRQASEKTEIRIGYNEHTFYVAVICYDSDPGRLVVSDARRDASLDNTDAFLFILDTYNDGQNGFVFGTNPLGIEYDAQVNNEGQGNLTPNPQQGGQIGGFNLNWDASWEVRTRVDGLGWSAEFAIPLRTLRYAPGPDQEWGLNFRRNIRKSNEIIYWASLPLEFNLNRLSMAGKLTGLNLKSPGNLKVMPYALGQIFRNFENGSSKSDFNTEFGADLKYSITPSLTLDLTYNTDFAQVEVDEQQVNLDRFNLFFPEKRPFFLENAGLFTAGSPGEVDLFFSRRIGIGEQGDLVPIIGGVRLTGKINRTQVGFLSMFTDDVREAGILENNFTAARMNHEFAGRSAVGAIFINRQGLNDLDDDYNRVMAIDGKWGLGQKAQLSGFYAQSITPGIDGGEHAFKVKGDYEWNQWIINVGYTEVGEGFNPEVGFLLRESYRKPEFLVLYHLRAGGKFGLLELRPHVSYRGYWNFNGFQETGFLHVDNHWEWENGLEIHTGINFTVEGVVTPFEISEGVFVPAGTYRHREAQLVLSTNQSKSISLSYRSNLGGFFGGKRYAHTASAYLRLGDKFNSEFGINYNDIQLPGGDFTTTIFRTRLSYSFTPRIFVQSLIQYNSVIDLWSSNIRFGWLKEANTGLFLVYNETRSDSGIQLRSFTVKYSRVFDLLR